jgi:hypothetical protein
VEVETAAMIEEDWLLILWILERLDGFDQTAFVLYLKKMISN